MSARSTQSARLAYELAGDIGLRRVDIRWSGTKRRGNWGGWRVEWTDGPTMRRMREFIETRAAQFPAVLVADLGYDRGSTDLAEVIALLVYVDRNRNWVTRIECPLLLLGYDEVDWPERADEVWQKRARALLRYARPPITRAGAVNILGTHARSGWAAALAWLDQLVAEHAAEDQALNVVDLANWRDGRAECNVGSQLPLC
jgi:hypothetical protein